MNTGKSVNQEFDAVDKDVEDARLSSVAAVRLAAIVESSDDAIVAKDLNGIITDWNRGAEQIFGYTAAEMVGGSITRIIPADRLGEEDLILEQIRRGERVKHFQTVRQRKDGSLIHVSVTVSPIRDGSGKVVGASKIARNITAQKAQEEELSRMMRLYSALSQINQAIVWTPTREELFQRICKVLVELGGFRMAWIGCPEPDTPWIRPAAVYGDATGYLQEVRIRSDDRPEGRGPTGQAFQTGQPVVCGDMHHNPVTGPWRETLLKHNFHASAGFPIRRQKEVCAVLTVYSEEPWFFRDREVALLGEAAGDISFALDNFAERERRRVMEAAAENERLFSATMIESMPGIIYFYDEQGRFLRWNRNFEAVSGYNAGEISRMHPLDFFAPEERAVLAQRIAEVFAKGDSFAEASFITKDGRAIPYFFTGRRVEFEGKGCLVGMGVDISERKRAELALRESEGKLRALFEQAPLGIGVVDSNTGRFLKVNPQYCKIAGYSEAEMLALTFQEITHPDDLAADLAGMRRLQSKVVESYHMEKRYRGKDGAIVWVGLTCVPLGREAGAGRQHIAMVEDITARKRAESRLVESEQKYRELVELANSIILRWTTKGEITFMNEFGQRFFGYQAGEIIGRHLVDTLVPATESSQRDLRALMDQICADPAAFEQNVNENVRRNGERVWISWTNRVLRDAGGRVTEILSVGTDITRQRQAEAALRVLNQTLEIEVAERTKDLQAALVRAESADRIKSAFLATMSHELRTPLNSIIGFTGILLQGLAGPLNDEQNKQLGMVRGSARHLLELINDVLDISKIEAGQVELRPAAFNVKESIERVAALIRPLAEKKKLELEVFVAPDTGEAVSDRRRVEQILLNMLNNAVKFTERGGVTLRAERIPEHVFPPGAPPQPALRVRVTDTGIGIRPEDMAALFQPFRQLDAGTERQHEGTGLGLAICRKLAALLGGEISAASEWRKGSEFTLLLPAQGKPPP